MPEMSDQRNDTLSGSGSSHREPIVAGVPTSSERDTPTIRRSGSSGFPTAGRAAEAIPPYPVSGDRIDTFELQEGIGVGGMGAVFRALDLRLDRLVALKLLPPEHCKDSEAVQRFYQEARAAARLDHENIARVFTIGHDQSYHFIAFEYIEGTTIRQRVSDQGPLPVADVINYMLQIAGSLVHASERGVVHRDIKPSNIIVTPQGRAKLVDMGLARRFERGASSQDGLTQSGMTLGTFDYISPEQAQDPRNVDIRSDLYSLGCTMFHMLTGRPPFPEGTVLQKLLQHREEPATDVRTINPEVPADLSAIILKLMAKDPDRRYQSPEQLVRDLLTLAGALGLRSVSPEGLVWMSAISAPSWERHLVWGLPSLALAVVVALLVWWGESDDSPGPSVSGVPDVVSALSSGAAKVAATGPSILPESPVAANREPPKSGNGPLPADTGTGSRSEFLIRSVDEFERSFAQAPWGATLVLAAEGPFDLNVVSTTPASTNARDLTIRAASGVRPVIRPNASTLSAVAGRAALLRFRGGRVTLEGLEFRLDPGDREDPLAAIHAENTDLTIQSCLFRTKSSSQSASRLDSVQLRPDPEAGPLNRPAPVVIRESHFDGGQTAIHIQGASEIRVAECTFGPSAPAPTFWFDNPSSGVYPKANLDLDHVSVLAGNGPVFKLERFAATIRLNDSIVAPPIGGESTLVATDDPDRVDWLGRGNLYARIGTYLQPTRSISRWQPITRFVNWAAEPTRTREIDSGASATAVWAATDPVDLSRGNQPTLAFLADPAELPEGATGVRIGPSGPVAPTIARVGLTPARSAEVTPSTELASASTRTSPAIEEPLLGPSVSEGPSRTAAIPFEPSREDDLSPMLRGQAFEEPVDSVVNGSAGSANRPGPETGVQDPTSPTRREITGRPDPPKPPPETENLDRSLVRNAGELRRVLAREDAPGDPIRLAAGSTLALNPQRIRGKGRWVVKGSSAGSPRPTIRLLRGITTDSEGRSLFHLEPSASLELRDLDVVVEGTSQQTSSPVAGFVLAPGSYLNLVGCTVTVIGGVRPAAVVRVVSPQTTPGNRAEETATVTSVRATDCLIRSRNDVVDIAPGTGVKLWFENSVIGAGGALANGHGQSRDLLQGQVDLEMNRCTTRTAGGLVVLESTPSEPTLPVAEARIRDSILATGLDRGPLLRVNGQDALEAGGDRIRWQGNSVAYHQIDTYRRDQTSQPGYMPLSFDRTDWGVAVGTRDIAPFHGDVGFLRPWDHDRPAWTITPEDAELSPSSPIRSYGPDLDVVARPAGTLGTDDFRDREQGALGSERE